MSKISSEKAAIEFIHALPRIHRKKDLTQIKAVLSAFGNPEKALKTIHLTGTNGKGSTAYYLNSLLQKAGFKTGLFVSPFIVQFNERVQVNSQSIMASDLIRLTNAISSMILELKTKLGSDFNLTEFEFLVVIAMLHFRESQVNYAVIEAGIGAKNDKTNVILPIVSLITSVGLDHEQLIGPSIMDIAAEKSGIIKQNVPLVLGKTPLDAKRLLVSEAQKKNAVLMLFAEDFGVHSDHQSDNFIYWSKSGELLGEQEIRLKMRPEIEQVDVALAITAFRLITDTLAIEVIADAINETVVPGRYQVIRNSPLVIIDGAHNEEAMWNFYRYLLQQKVKRSGSQIHFLIALMKDKDIAAVLNLVKEEEVLLTTIDYQRAAKEADYKNMGITRDYEDNLAVAYYKLLQESNPDDIIAVTGSFYLVSEFIKMVGDRDAN